MCILIPLLWNAAEHKFLADIWNWESLNMASFIHFSLNFLIFRFNRESDPWIMDPPGEDDSGLCVLLQHRSIITSTLSSLEEEGTPDLHLSLECGSSADKLQSPRPETPRVPPEGPEPEEPTEHAASHTLFLSRTNLKEVADSILQNSTLKVSLDSTVQYIHQTSLNMPLWGFKQKKKKKSNISTRTLSVQIFILSHILISPRQLSVLTVSLYRLKNLYLEGNQISNLPDSMFISLPNLLWLDLRNNQIPSIPAGIGLHR